MKFCTSDITSRERRKSDRLIHRLLYRKTMADKEESLAAAVNLLTLLASDSGKETFFLPTLDGASSSSSSSSSKQKCLFFECSSTALQALSKMFLPSTPDALKLTALKSIAKKARRVELTEKRASFNDLFGYGISKKNETRLRTLFTESEKEKRYGAVISVRLKCGESVAVCGLFEDGESGFGKASFTVDSNLSLSSFVAYPLAPSTTFLELQSTPEKETDEVKWLYCDDKGNARTEDMPYFKWKGKLRPHKISHQEKLYRGMRKVPDTVVKAEWWETSRPLAEERARQQRVADELPQKEIEKLRKACVIGRGAIDCVVRAIRPGVTPEALDVLCHDYICDKNAYPSPLNYYCFPKSCCISVNEVICHGIPDCRPLEEGDIVNIDVTAFFGGYHGDLNETVFVGSSGDEGDNAEKPDSEEVADGVDDSSKKEAFKLLKCAYECLADGMSIVKPDTRYRDIGEKVSAVASKYNCSVVKTYCGHGIGKHFHCFPNVPHYKGNKAAGAMKPGHAFTIEPMINLGKEWRDELWPDGWTAVTKDGSLSAQYEHTMVCTTDGVDVLTKRNKNSPRVFPFTEYEDTGDDDDKEEGADKEKVVAELEELVNEFNTKL